MEKVEKAHSLKRDFTIIVMVTILCVFLASLATIFGCYRVHKYVLPDSNEVWIHTKMTMPDGAETKQRFVIDQAAQMYLLTKDGQDPPTAEKTEYTVERIESS